jgi:hypothetical protein
MALGLLVAACSDSTLADLGSHASEWIGESEPNEVAGGEVVVASSVPVESVGWWNTDLEDVDVSTGAEQVVAAVIARSSGVERYLQATPLEIAAAVPELVFPVVVPVGVVQITSQLVVGPGRDRLDDEVVVAFGLWTVEPYSKSRSAGQRGTIVVGTPAATAVCDRLAAGAASSCTSETLDEIDVVRVDSDSGQTWVWSTETHEYQLFLRGALANNDGIAHDMIGGTVPFSVIAGLAGGA